MRKVYLTTFLLLFLSDSFGCLYELNNSLNEKSFKEKMTILKKLKRKDMAWGEAAAPILEFWFLWWCLFFSFWNRVRKVMYPFEKSSNFIWLVVLLYVKMIFHLTYCICLRHIHLVPYHSDTIPFTYHSHTIHIPFLNSPKFPFAPNW